MAEHSAWKVPLNQGNKRRKKDPNKPKSAKTAYQFFAEEKRPVLKQENLSIGEISTKLSELWKNQRDKSKYEEKARKDKVRYEKEMAKYEPEPEEEEPSNDEEEVVEEKEKKKKKKKDKNAPKGAKTAYQHFSDEKRPELIESGLKGLGEISSRLSEMWKEQEDKSEYEAMAKKDKVRYLNEMAKYKPVIEEEDEEEEEVEKKKKKKKDPNRPKAVRSAYQFFCEEKRPKLMKDGMKVLGEISTKLSELWKQQVDKSKYEKKSNNDKIRFQAEMADYKPPEESSDDEESDREGGKKKRKKKDKNAPKGVKSAYLFFCDEQRPLLADEGVKGFAEVSTKLSEKWKLIVDKSKYEKLAAKDKVRYQSEMKTYKDSLE